MPRPKSNFVSLYGELIRKMYVNENKSIPEINEHILSLNIPCNTQKIWRALKEMRVERRTPEEAQKLALSNGRAKHPTEGKPLSEENKKHLSESLGKKWAEITDEERTRRAERSRAQYNGLSDRKRKNLHHKAAQAIRQAGIEGSKLERYLVDELSKLNYKVVFHKKGAILNEDLEIDILLPAQKIAIEVDGIYHVEDVFGDLGKVSNRDSQKNGLLLAAGYVIIRLSNTAKTCSQYYMSRKLAQLLEVIQQIEKEFPPLDGRLIYISELKKE